MWPIANRALFPNMLPLDYSLCTVAYARAGGQFQTGTSFSPVPACSTKPNNQRSKKQCVEIVTCMYTLSVCKAEVSLMDFFSGVEQGNQRTEWHLGWVGSGGRAVDLISGGPISIPLSPRLTWFCHLIPRDLVYKRLIVVLRSLKNCSKECPTFFFFIENKLLQG